MKENSSLLFSASLWSIILNVVRTASMFLIVPFAIVHLGNERYGLWMLTISLSTVTTFMDMGLIPTFTNILAQAYGRGDIKQFQYYINVGIVLSGIVLLLGIVMSSILSIINWQYWLNVKNESILNEVLPLVIVMWLTGIVTVSLSTITSIYSAQLKFNTLRIAETVGSVLGVGIVILSIQYDASLPTIAFLYNAPPIFVRLWLLKKLIKTDINFQDFDFRSAISTLKKMIPTSTLFMGIQAFAVFQSIIPGLYIAHFANLSDVATFNLTLRIITIPISFLSAILPVFWPTFTIAWNRNQFSWIYKRLKLACAVSTLFVVIYIAIILVFQSRILLLWTKGMISPSASLLLLLGAWLVTQILVNWLSTFLHSITDFNFEFWCYAVTTILMLLLSYALIGKFAKQGVTAAMFISLFIGSLLPMIARVKSKLTIVIPNQNNLVTQKV